MHFISVDVLLIITTSEKNVAKKDINNFVPSFAPFYKNYLKKYLLTKNTKFHKM